MPRGPSPQLKSSPVAPPPAKAAERPQNVNLRKRPAEKRHGTPNFTPPADPAKWPLIDFFERIYCKENPRLFGGSPRTRIAYRNGIFNAQRYFDLRQKEAGEDARPLLLADVTADFVTGAMQWQLMRGRSPATANKLRRELMALQRFAALDKDFLPKPLYVRTVKEPKRKVVGWSMDDYNRILRAATQMPGRVGPVLASRWWPALLLTLFNTGLRISAYMKCPASGLDLARARLIVPAEVQKQNSDQVFDLLPITVDALALIKPERLERLGDDWPYDRHQNHWRSLTLRLRKLLCRSGLYRHPKEIGPKELFHKFRRTFASHCAARIGISGAQQGLGHADQSTTMRSYIDRSIAGGPRLSDVLPSPQVVGISRPAFTVQPAGRSCERSRPRWG